MNEEANLAGSCGLYCGLCPRFQSKAPSRCVGCQLGEQHSYCSLYRCCNRHGLHTCANCDEYPCERLLRVLGIGTGLDSFISHRPALPNIERIRKIGIQAYLVEQRERRLLLEHLLAHYNEGRSMSFYCAACALMPPELIAKALKEIKDIQVDLSDLKAKARAMRELIARRASEAGIDIGLRKA